MEEVSLNSEPLFDEDDGYEDEGDETMLEQDIETAIKVPPLPTVGLEYDSFDEAYSYYNNFAKKQGFGIRVSNSWFRAKRKERYRAKLSCSSAGFKKKSEANHPRPETRTGCPAMIVIRLMDSKRWRIIEVELQHNHPVSPEIKRFYKSHKRMILAAQKGKQKVPVTEVQTIKLYRTVVVDTFADFNENETLSHVDQSKHLKLKEGDAHALYNFFCRMKLTNPNFFYLMDFDDEGRLRNVFWSDWRSRASCSYFCDTVVIDTTCVVNKFEIPLIIFFGVNHHGQNVLLGCGFVGHESVDHFIWIFKAWITSIVGRSPQVIITDQSKSLQTAISQVFSGARHCHCSWYIMQRLQEKLGGLPGYEVIKIKLTKAVYNSLKISEFETSWINMIKQHELGNNKWLQSLYEDRRRWVPVYLKDTFLAGMFPIQEKETLNPFFDGYVHKHTSFKEFVDKYDLALHRRHLKEAVSDLESSNSSFELKTKSSFELQLSKVYTKDIFVKFQSEVEGMYSCFNTNQVNATGPILTYIVKEKIENEAKEKEIKSYEVLIETTQVDIRCVCGLFNFKGYLCRHALTVLNYNGIEVVPSRYVLERWSKDFKRKHVIDHAFNGTDSDGYVNWYNHLLSRALQVLEEGVQSEEHCKAVLHELEKLLNKFSIVDDNLCDQVLELDPSFS